MWVWSVPLHCFKIKRPTVPGETFLLFFPPKQIHQNFYKMCIQKGKCVLVFWIFVSLLVKTQPLRSIQSPPIVKLTAVGSQFYIYIYMLCLQLFKELCGRGGSSSCSCDISFPCWKWQCQHRCSIDSVCACVCVLIETNNLTSVNMWLVGGHICTCVLMRTHTHTSLTLIARQPSTQGQHCMGNIMLLIEHRK